MEGCGLSDKGTCLGTGTRCELGDMRGTELGGDMNTRCGLGTVACGIGNEPGGDTRCDLGTVACGLGTEPGGDRRCGLGTVAGGLGTELGGDMRCGLAMMRGLGK